MHNLERNPKKKRGLGTFLKRALYQVGNLILVKPSILWPENRCPDNNSFQSLKKHGLETKAKSYEPSNDISGDLIENMCCSQPNKPNVTNRLQSTLDTENMVSSN